MRQAQAGWQVRWYCVYCSRRECKRKCKWEGAAPVTKGGVSVLTLEQNHRQRANEEGMRDVENTLEHSRCDTPGVCIYT